MKLAFLRIAIVLSAVVSLQGGYVHATSLCAAKMQAVRTQDLELPLAQKKTAPASQYRGLVVVDTSAVEQNLASISPALREFLRPGGPFGYGGVVGPLSAANSLGPVGNRWINPSKIISDSFKVGDLEMAKRLGWSEWARFNNSHGGPLDDRDGIFSSTGPSSPFSTALSKYIPFSDELDQGGLFALIGRDGILGDRSSVGPLGSIGAHGYRRDPTTGAFMDGDRIVNSVEATDANGKPILEPLCPDYEEGYAKTLSSQGQLKNGFTVEMGVADGQSSDLVYHAKAGTFLAIAPIPDGMGDSFALQVLSEDGKTTLAYAHSKELMNSALLHVPHDAVYRIRVINTGKSPYFNPIAQHFYEWFPNYWRLSSTFPPVLAKTGKLRLHVIQSPQNTAAPVKDGRQVAVFQ